MRKHSAALPIQDEGAEFSDSLPITIKEDGLTPTVKRLNVNLPAALFDELQELASRSGRTMTDLVRIALGLVRIGIEETAKGNRLAVTSSEGNLFKEILIPK